MSPTARAAILLAVLSLAALLLPLGLVALAAAALVVVTGLDAWSVRGAPTVRRTIPPVLSRRVGVRVAIAARMPSARRLRLRQSTPPELVLDPSEGIGTINGELVALIRGRHVLPELGTRAEGRLGLGAANRRGGGTAEVEVYPDLVSARRLAVAAHHGQLVDSRKRARGPLGLGTDFESVREWTPDDDVRRINWAATGRLGRPMTNQFRLEQARELLCLIDSGRLMAAPLEDRGSRLDLALDAVAAVGLAADELGDHCGTLAFDAEVRVQLQPRRGGGREVVRALFDLQPRPLDSDYELAFRRVGMKRSLVLVFTDLFDDDAARALIEAVPVLGRRHAVLVATVTDPDLDHLVRSEPTQPSDVYAAAAALDLLDARVRASALLRRAGAQVVEATPERFPAACVRTYLAAKAQLRL